MKKTIVVVLTLLSLGFGVHAAEDPLQQGMKLYQKHHYTDAARVLHGYLAQADAGQKAQAQMSFGMVCLANARLYGALHNAATAVQVDYYRKLVNTAKGDAGDSRMAPFFLGQVYLETGKLAEAQHWLEKFITTHLAGDRLYTEAQIALGTVYHLQQKTEKAGQLWQAIEDTPNALAALAAAYNQAGLTGKGQALFDGQVRPRLPTSSRRLDILTVRALLQMFAQAGRIEQGFETLARIDLKAFVHEETMQTDKSVRFYDPALLDRLRQLYARTAVIYFKKADQSGNDKLRPAARYFLADAYLLAEQPADARQVLDRFLEAAKGPRTYRQRATVKQAVCDARLGAPQALRKMLSRVNGKKARPVLLGEILLECGQNRIECPQVVQLARTLLAQLDDRSAVGLTVALGSYYLHHQQYEPALTHLEAGRDKSRKNRIDANPPVMLIHLAQAYYRSKQFSEALEIYFEMSKQFPAVRQIQVALQGVYAMEQRSAGDAKIF